MCWKWRHFWRARPSDRYAGVRRCHERSRVPLQPQPFWTAHQKKIATRSCAQQGHAVPTRRQKYGGKWKACRVPVLTRRAHARLCRGELYEPVHWKHITPKNLWLAVINQFRWLLFPWTVFFEIAPEQVAKLERPPCINKQWLLHEYWWVKCGQQVLFISSGLEARTLLKKFWWARKMEWPYLHLQQFIEIAPAQQAGAAQNSLVSVGAFRFTGKSKTLLWGSQFLQKHQSSNGGPLVWRAALQFDMPGAPPIAHWTTLQWWNGDAGAFTLGNPLRYGGWSDPAKYGSAKIFPVHLHKILPLLKLILLHATCWSLKNNDAMFFGTFGDSNWTGLTLLCIFWRYTQNCLCTEQAFKQKLPAGLLREDSGVLAPK